MATRTFVFTVHVEVLQTLQTTTNSVTLVIYMCALQFSLFAVVGSTKSSVSILVNPGLSKGDLHECAQSVHQVCLIQNCNPPS